MLHAVHAPPLGPEYPALHRQSTTSSDPDEDCENDGQFWHVASVFPDVIENVPGEQLVHPADPDIVLNVPALHTVQLPPLGPVYPALQRQLATCELPATDCVFATQLRHTLLTAAIVVEYWFAKQSVHVAGPVELFHFPATHASHGVTPFAADPPGPVNPILQIHAAKALLASGA